MHKSTCSPKSVTNCEKRGGRWEMGVKTRFIIVWKKTQPKPPMIVWDFQGEDFKLEWKMGRWLVGWLVGGWLVVGWVVGWLVGGWMVTHWQLIWFLPDSLDNDIDINNTKMKMGLKLKMVSKSLWNAPSRGSGSSPPWWHTGRRWAWQGRCCRSWWCPGWDPPSSPSRLTRWPWQGGSRWPSCWRGEKTENHFLPAFLLSRVLLESTHNI